MNLAKANCTGNHVCMSCDKVVIGHTFTQSLIKKFKIELRQIVLRE